MEEQNKSLKDYWKTFRRHKKKIAIAMGSLMVLSVLVAAILPPVFRSTATILIEEQEVPADLVRSTITSFADQRIQVISQQVMTRANLMQIVEKYDLYKDERRYETTEQILERMRKDIRLNMVSAETIDRLRGVKVAATIAFTLSYDSEKPSAAQKVANELVTLYLNENLKNRQQKTEETSKFLTQEAERLNQQIAEAEQKLAVFKAKNYNRLPELASLNISMRDRTDSEIREVERQINAADERKIYLDAQLIQINPYTNSVSASGERILNPEDRLKILQSQYASMSGIYAANHPDIQKMRREIEALKKETGSAADSQEQQKRLASLRGELVSKQEKYSEDHPDVIKLKKAIAALEESVNTKHTTADSVVRKPENPAYISMQAQLEATKTELKTLRAKRDELRGKMASYEGMLRGTPEVEREYQDLNRDRENAVRKYQEIRAKQQEARVAQELEKDSKGERFSLIDPPQLPEEPTSPNRPAILLLGLVLSFGGGIAYAGIMEAFDPSVRNSRELVAIVNAPLMGLIPYVENSADRLAKRKFKKRLVVSLIVATFASLTLAHFFWRPLDVVWYQAVRKAEVYLPAPSAR